jgi:hypothetical protein
LLSFTLAKKNSVKVKSDFPGRSFLKPSKSVWIFLDRPNGELDSGSVFAMKMLFFGETELIFGMRGSNSVFHVGGVFWGFQENRHWSAFLKSCLDLGKDG